MKFLNGIAAVVLAMMPHYAMAQVPQSQADCAEGEAFVLGDPAQGTENSCEDPDGLVVAQGGALPILASIPAGATVAGGLVIVGGVIIGVTSAFDDDDDTPGTTTTTTTTTTN
ncbi:MAG: hypothetical protein AAGK00_20370 [Pseudomonadota bacterium]